MPFFSACEIVCAGIEPSFESLLRAQFCLIVECLFFAVSLRHCRKKNIGSVRIVVLALKTSSVCSTLCCMFNFCIVLEFVAPSFFRQEWCNHVASEFLLGRPLSIDSALNGF